MSLEILEKPRSIKAWDRFLELGLPTKKTENYRYVRLKNLYETPFYPSKDFQPHLEPSQGTLVFVNGAFHETLSMPPAGVVALPLSKAYKTYGGFLNSRQEKQLKEEKDPFAALNGAYYSEGLFLYIPPKTCLETPLNIIHLIDPNGSPAHLCPRIHLFAGKGAVANLSFSQNNGAEGVWVNSFIDCALEESAHISFNLLFQQHESAHDFFAFRATLKSRSVLKSISVTNGSATSRHDYALHLLGEQAEAALYGAWGLAENRQHHVHVLMEHHEPSCRSLQKFKGALADASHSSFEGKIHVHQKAQKTEAYQMNNNLILGERASANSKPNLEIFADDVKASHGSTTGQLDEEQLFYLTARGLSKSLAKTLLVRGFSEEILNLIEDKEKRGEAIRIIS